MNRVDLQEINVSDEELELQLPKPVGYRVLVALPKVEDKYEGTELLKTDKEKHYENIMSIICFNIYFYIIFNFAFG